MMSHGDGRHDELGQELVVLYVQDEINKALTGHGGPSTRARRSRARRR